MPYRIFLIKKVFSFIFHKLKNTNGHITNSHQFVLCQHSEALWILMVQVRTNWQQK